MKPFTIIMPDRVGLISDISYILSKERINIDGLDVCVVGKKIAITLRVKNPHKAKEILKKNGFANIINEYCIVKITDKPGEMTKLTGMLKEKRINIINLHQIPMGGKKALVAIKTNKPRMTIKILKPWMLDSED